jgi:glucosamine--fructose-6-phosphate aminotransferase (isomerizing)
MKGGSPVANPNYKMYENIHRTPDDLRAILENGWQPAAEVAVLLAAAERVFTVGIGTSYHAAANAAFHLRAAGADAEAVSSYDFVVYPPALRAGDVVVVFSHRGFKRFSADSMQRAKAAGAKVVVVTGIASAVTEADAILRTTIQETSAAFTASHTGAMLVTAQVACELATLHGTPILDRGAFEPIPNLIEDLFAREGEIERVAAASLDRRIYAAGAGPDGLLATEIALKAREAAFTTIDGMATEQFIHGPLVTVSAGDLAILVATHEAGRKRTRDLLQILDTIGVESWIIGRLPEPPASATTFDLPDLPDPLAPVLGVIPVQLFACYQAHAKGTNADGFRRDDPLYGEAFGKVTL